MGTFAYWAGVILARIAQLVGIVGQVQQILDRLKPNSLAWQVDHLWSWMAGGAVSYASFYDGLHTELATVLTAISDLSDKIDTYTHEDGAQVAVNLPITAPEGYGGGGSTAEEVWGYQLLNYSGTATSADQLLSWAGAYARTHGNTTAVRSGRNPWFAFSSTWFEGNVVVDNIYEPEPDWADMREGDTVLSWLQRTEPSFNWAYDSRYDLVVAPLGPSGPELNIDVLCLMHQADFDMVRLGYPASSSSPAGLPIWPGVADVTLGDPVALSDDLTVEGPLDGVLIHVTNIPKGLGRFTVGERTFFYKCGEIAFVSDNGYVEPWQYMTWDHGLYTPKTMAHADHAIIRALSDAAGTATPWSVTV